jgi:outer membrane biosynthesis protein TonB
MLCKFSVIVDFIIVAIGFLFFVILMNSKAQMYVPRLASNKSAGAAAPTLPPPPPTSPPIPPPTPSPPTPSPTPSPPIPPPTPSPPPPTPSPPSPTPPSPPIPPPKEASDSKQQCPDKKTPYFDSASGQCVECMEDFNCIVGYQRCYKNKCLKKNSPQCAYYPIGALGRNI